MRIIQMLPVFTVGDAIGNDVVAVYGILKELGYETHIYAEIIDERLKACDPKDYRLYEDREDDIILYHLSTGSALNTIVCRYKAHLIVVYHNITPPGFMEGWNMEAARSCSKGLRAARYMAKKAEYVIADSEYNLNELRSMGYDCGGRVLPILIPFSDYDRPPSEEIINKYGNDGYTNILFTGRIAPNKKQEDIIRSFYCYHKFINPKSRLVLAGSYDINGRYFRRLMDYIGGLGLNNDIVLTGHIPFAEILGYYRTADVFLCLSEHEGFCVPIVEAMYFGIPIIAYDSTAVRETLKNGGMLLEDKDPRIVAEAIDLMMSDETLKKGYLEQAKKRLSDFSYDKTKELYAKAMEEIILQTGCKEAGVE